MGEAGTPPAPGTNPELARPASAVTLTEIDIPFASAFFLV
jgi:hypothetical protein